MHLCECVPLSLGGSHVEIQWANEVLYSSSAYIYMWTITCYVYAAGIYSVHNVCVYYRIFIYDIYIYDI